MAHDTDEQLLYGVRYLEQRMAALSNEEQSINHYIEDITETYRNMGQVNRNIAQLNEEFEGLGRYAQSITELMDKSDTLLDKAQQDVEKFTGRVTEMGQQLHLVSGEIRKLETGFDGLLQQAGSLRDIAARTAGEGAGQQELSQAAEALAAQLEQKLQDLNQNLRAAEEAIEATHLTKLAHGEFAETVQKGFYEIVDYTQQVKDYSGQIICGIQETGAALEEAAAGSESVSGVVASFREHIQKLKAMLSKKAVISYSAVDFMQMMENLLLERKK